MNKKILHHSFTELAKKQGGGNEVVSCTLSSELMFDGQMRARDIAKSSGHDIRHEVYNDPLCRWEFLGIYHPDGTCTHWTGEHKLFVEDPARPWVEIEATDD